MRIYVLTEGGHVAVEETPSASPGYVSQLFPSGELYRIPQITSDVYQWERLHRQYAGVGPAWSYAVTKNVPEAVRFARMLVD